MKFLTIRQPWASLIAVGAKTIETRPFRTDYRGPLAIHAGLHVPSQDDMLLIDGSDGRDGRLLPLGAVVAVCDLVDVVPIVDEWPDDGACIRQFDDGETLLYRKGHGYGDDIGDQLPFGDFTPGRYAWLLDDVRPLRTPVPMKGAQGLRDLPATITEQLPG